MWRIPLSDLNYGPEEERAVLDVLRSRWLTMGPRTEEFEARFAAHTGARHAVAVANCTCGLELVYAWAMCRAADAHGAGPEPFGFIVPDITFVATASAALTSGARAVLTDIRGAARPSLCPDAASRALARGGSRVAAVSLVHYAGFDAGAAEMLALARAHGVVLVEDAAHAAGGRAADGRHLGTLGDAGVFSFFSNKNLATGEGGMVVTDNADLAAAVRAARSHGMTASTHARHATRGHGYDVAFAGHNYRCTEITAALGLAQLARLDEANARRRALYRLYRDLLAATDRVALPFSADDEVARGACHILPLVCESEALRDAVRAACDGAGIQTSHHYPPIHTFSGYRRLAEADDDAPRPACPRSEEFARREITLPLWPGMGEGAVEEVCAVVLGAARRAAP